LAQMAPGPELAQVLAGGGNARKRCCSGEVRYMRITHIR
jgi:hypothetical protein